MLENQNRVKKLRQEFVNKIIKKIEKKGVKSEFENSRVLKIKTDGIEGDPSPRKIKELSDNYMLDSSGYHYEYATLSTDNLAWLVDNI
jgi:hypothetical protein